MSITKEDMKKAEEGGKVSDSVERIRWKKLITDMLKEKGNFLTAMEIRESLKASTHVYSQIHYLKKSETLKMKVLNGSVYYGLKEWE